MCLILCCFIHGICLLFWLWLVLVYVYGRCIDIRCKHYRHGVCRTILYLEVSDLFYQKRSLENDFVIHLLRSSQIAFTHFSPTAPYLCTYHFRVLRKIKLPLHGTCVKQSFHLFGRVILFLVDDHHALFVQYFKTDYFF